MPQSCAVHRIIYSSRHVLIALAMTVLFLSSCGTGIEVTEHVTDKDVQRVIGKGEKQETSVTIDAYVDSMAGWNQEKRFWVASERVKQMLMYAGLDLDTLQLAGHILRFDGWRPSDLYNNESRNVDIIFRDEATGQSLVYRYGKPVDSSRTGVTLPMLIDLDMVRHIAQQVEGKDFYIRTAIWYHRQTEQMMDGRHYIKVHIDSVLPGNAVMPLRVLFTTADTQERAMVWMSDNSSTMHGRDFDAMFTASNPRLSYPEISDENWTRITRGQVVEGMNKIECQLSLGTPKRINEIPDQAGLREYWYYDGGSYLYFVDGLLRQFRI